MKHAFLVIAHNNFGVLQRIVSLLDCDGFDFFIHIDKKVKVLPEIHAKHSRVSFCEPRIDVRWGDVSQIECELTLMDFALRCDLCYDYYHVISGTHLPLVEPEEFDRYFSSHPMAVFQPMETSKNEIDMKIRRWNLCTRTFKHESVFIERSSQMIWRIGNAAQRILGIRRFCENEFLKVCTWCSLSAEATRFLVNQKKAILHKYEWSFCGDEFFAVSEISSSYNNCVHFRNDYLYQRFEGASPIELNNYDSNLVDGYLWARKFGDKKISLRILKK